mmetsp:Transcript_13912/g.30049  ORF Transcript_13912/g.30049 Transcript_13912/m.30049 type:complete len:89 (+) Transcript_13912:622-888(+)
MVPCMHVVRSVIMQTQIRSVARSGDRPMQLAMPHLVPMCVLSKCPKSASSLSATAQLRPQLQLSYQMERNDLLEMRQDGSWLRMLSWL